MASRSITFAAIMLFGASYAPSASANGPQGFANTNEWFTSLGLPTPPPLFLPNGQPFPQQNFAPIQANLGNGMSMSSSSSSNGPGGTTITVTQNGETQTFTLGDNPPPPAFQPSAPVEPKKPTPPKMLNLNFPKFKPFTFKPMVFEPITFEPIKMIDPEEIKNFKPNGNSNYMGMSTSSFSSSSTKNGETVSTGGIHSITNVNGVVTEKSIILNGGNAQESENQNEV